MKNASKYARSYFAPPKARYNWMKKEYISKAPVWCSVDLRDGNQSLIVPMNIEKKLLFFNLLLKLGFKEIEVGFPASSDTEYAFVRKLIEEDLIPDDVTIQVITTARKSIIQKTLKSIEGAKKVIVHIYNPISLAQREQVFKKSKDEIAKIATDGVKLIKDFADKFSGEITLNYCPESFTGAEPEYALEVINKVLDVWQPTPERRAILNIAATVELSLPHIYANQIEYISDNVKYRENVLITVHNHNDRGSGVAAAELGLLAGADRVEGTLFGNGERTGNADLVTMAMNMYSHGVDPKLELHNLPELIDEYEELTSMSVHPRHPYAGALVFAAFSGSHQDAIAKGIAYRKDNPDIPWNVPYLAIDPSDIGRSYETDVIRINSQSGKGGIGYVMREMFGYTLPAGLREHFGVIIKEISDHKEKELKPQKVFDIFKDNYLDIEKPLEFNEVSYSKADGLKATVTLIDNGEMVEYSALGNGRLDSVANALRDPYLHNFHITTYEEHSLNKKSDSKAAAYIAITDEETKMSFWGVGTDEDIIHASIKALISAINNKISKESKEA